MSSSDNDQFLPKEPDYWQKLIHKVEYLAHDYIKKKTLKDFDYSSALPADLRERVQNIVPVPDDIEEVFSDEIIEVEEELEEEEEDEEAKTAREAAKKSKKDQDFNESTCTEVLRMEKEYAQFELNIQAPQEDQDKEGLRTQNWIKDYICKKRRDRVQWESKLYRMERTLNEMTLEEQAEELMDASAEKFCNWINSLGSSGSTTVQKDKLKALFSIEGEKNLYAAVSIDPTIVHAISKAVADRWNMPQMAIELIYDEYLKKRLKGVPKKIIKVAFGRTVPEKDRPWTPGKDDKPITTVFPEKLLSQEVLFKGIRHLRTTKALVEFLEKHPKFEKPRYLVRSKMFDAKRSSSSKKDIPLYERLKLKY